MNMKSKAIKNGMSESTISGSITEAKPLPKLIPYASDTPTEAIIIHSITETSDPTTSKPIEIRKLVNNPINPKIT